jgi:acetylornithine deacetylase/succinyl-diaminopimelate desuccinylase-like protein
MGDVDDVRGWLESRRDHLLAELIGWVRIRSVAGPAEHAIELRRSAQWLAGTLREVGFPTVEV